MVVAWQGCALAVRAAMSAANSYGSARQGPCCGHTWPNARRHQRMQAYGDTTPCDDPCALTITETGQSHKMFYIAARPCKQINMIYMCACRRAWMTSKFWICKSPNCINSYIAITCHPNLVGSQNAYRLRVSICLLPCCICMLCFQADAY